MGYGRIYLLTLLVALLLAACDPGTQGSSPVPGGADARSGADAGLTAELVGWLFPVEAGDFEAGNEVFLGPFHRHRTLKLAGCMEADGYRELAEALRLDPPARFAGLGLVLFPAPPELDVNAVAESLDHMPADVLFSGVSSNPGGLSDEKLAAESRQVGIEILAQTLERFPGFGVSPSGAEVLYESMAKCQEQSAQATPEIVQYASGLGDGWLETLNEIDSEPVVAGALATAASCLRAVDGQFETVDSPADWLWRWDAAASTTDPTDTERWTELRSWLDDYYGCMVPVIDARRPLRLAAREEVVDRQLPQLLELQAELHRALQGLEE